MNISSVRNFRFNQLFNLKNVNHSNTQKINKCEIKRNDNIYSGSLLPYLSNIGLNISFGGGGYPIYAINIENGEYTKYKNQTKAAKALGISHPAQISSILWGKNETSHGYTFVFAEDVETKDDKGNTVVDEGKIQKIFEKIKEAKAKAIYSINIESKKYTRYESQIEAAKTLRISKNAISNVLKRRIKSSHGFTFVHARDVERKDENGNILVDEREIQKILKRSKEAKTKAIYAIKDNIHTRYESQVEASEKLGIPAVSINAVLRNRNKTAHGYRFVYASDAEREDENEI